MKRKRKRAKRKGREVASRGSRERRGGASRWGGGRGGMASKEDIVSVFYGTPKILRAMFSKTLLT